MVFLFFGFPGAGKSTLVETLGRQHGVAAIDTDHFMTEPERAAVLSGRYTQAMRLANIRRYCAHVHENPACRPHVALADGLPNNAARRYALDRFSSGGAVLVLVRTEPSLWQARLHARTGNVVDVGVTAADAYVRANWEPVADSLPHDVVDNGEDAAAVASRLDEIFHRYAGG